MKSVVLQVAKHEEYGMLGMRWKRWMEPFTGMGVAHDLLEHFPNDSGSTEEELMALGASFLVRHFGEYHANKGAHNPNPGYQMSVDLVEQINYKMQRGEGMFLRDPGRTKKCEDIDEYIEVAIREARQEALSRMDDDDELVGFLRVEEESKIYGWMRRGFRKAQRRYRKHKSYYVCLMFQTIEDTVDRYLKHAEDYGQEVRVTYDLERGTCRVVEIGGEDDY